MLRSSRDGTKGTNTVNPAPLPAKVENRQKRPIRAAKIA